MSATRVVLADFYGTLARATSWGPRFEELLAARGVVLTPEVRARWSSDALDGCEHTEHSVSRERYVAWEQARIAAMLAECGCHPVDRLVTELWRASKTWSLEPYPEVPDVLADLRRKGVRVVVCSNWDWDLDVAIERAGLAGLVDASVTSARVGARKPHPRIYRAALTAAGDPDPAGVVFVGDSWHADVAGPCAAGMRAVHLHRPDDTREPPPLPPGVTRLADLGGLADLLGA